MLSRLATRSRYRSFMVKEKLRKIEEAENIENRAAGRKYYVANKRQYGCVVTSEMCQLKALAITKELGITCFKGTLRLSSSDRLADADLASRGYRRSMTMVNHA